MRKPQEASSGGKCHHPLYRFLALFLCVSVALGHNSGLANFETLLVDSVKSSPEGIACPKDFGSVEEISQGSNGKTVLYIQDAHDSLEAQENIARMIAYYVERYGAKIVMEEGYEGPVPTEEYFGAIRNPELREKVAYFLMDKLRLGGAEYAHIVRKKDFELLGVDDFSLHRKNIEFYQRSEKHRRGIEKDLNRISSEIRKLAQKRFTKELKEWIENKEKFEREEMGLFDYLKRSQRLFLRGGELEEFAAAYPHISLLLSAAETEDETLLKKLRAVLRFKNLFSEMNRMEDDYARARFSRDSDREIFRYYKMLELLKRLNAIRITQEEYEAVKETLRGVTTDSIAQFIVSQTHESLVLPAAWEKQIDSAIQFYETAYERDAAIRRHLEAYERDSGKEPVILVYGGFHKEAIKEILAERGFSYSLIAPKITAVSPTHQAYYKQLMSMGFNSVALPSLVSKAAVPVRIPEYGAVEPEMDSDIHRLVSRVTLAAQLTGPGDGRSSLAQMDLYWNQMAAVEARFSRSELRHVSFASKFSSFGGSDSSQGSESVEVLETHARGGIRIAQVLKGKGLEFKTNGEETETYKEMLRGLRYAGQHGLLDPADFPGDLYVKMARNLGVFAVRKRNTIYVDEAMAKEFAGSKDVLAIIFTIVLTGMKIREGEDKSHYGEYLEQLEVLAAEKTVYKKLPESEKEKLSAWLAAHSENSAFAPSMKRFLDFLKEPDTEKNNKEFIEKEFPRYKGIESMREKKIIEIRQEIQYHGLETILSDRRMRAVIVDYDLDKGIPELLSRMSDLEKAGTEIFSVPADRLDRFALRREQNVAGKSRRIISTLAFGEDLARFISSRPDLTTLNMLTLIQEYYGHERGYRVMEYEDVYSVRLAIHGKNPALLQSWRTRLEGERAEFENSAYVSFPSRTIRLITEILGSDRDLFQDSEKLKELAGKLEEKATFPMNGQTPREFILRYIKEQLNTHFSSEITAGAKPFDEALVKNAVLNAGYLFGTGRSLNRRITDAWPEFMRQDLSYVMDLYIHRENGHFILGQELYESEDLERFMAVYGISLEDARAAVLELKRRSFYEAQLGKTFEAFGALLYKLAHPGRRMYTQYHVLENGTEAYFDLVYETEGTDDRHLVEMKLGGTFSMRTSAKDSFNKYWSLLNYKRPRSTNRFLPGEKIEFLLLHPDQNLKSELDADRTNVKFAGDLISKIPAPYRELIREFMESLQAAHKEQENTYALTLQSLKKISAFLTIALTYGGNTEPLLSKSLQEDDLIVFGNLLSLMKKVYLDRTLDESDIENFMLKQFGKIELEEMKYVPDDFSDSQAPRGYQPLWDEGFRSRVSSHRSAGSSSQVPAESGTIAAHTIAREYVNALQITRHDESLGALLQEGAQAVYSADREHEFPENIFVNLEMYQKINDAMAVEEINPQEISYLEKRIEKIMKSGLSEEDFGAEHEQLISFILGFGRSITRFAAFEIAYFRFEEKKSGDLVENVRWERMGALKRYLEARLGILSALLPEVPDDSMSFDYRPSFSNRMLLIKALTAHSDKAEKKEKLLLNLLIQSHLIDMHMAHEQPAQSLPEAERKLAITLFEVLGPRPSLSHGWEALNRTLLTMMVFYQLQGFDDVNDMALLVQVGIRMPKDRKTLYEVGKIVAFGETKKHKYYDKNVKSNAVRFRRVLTRVLLPHQIEYFNLGYKAYADGEDRNIVEPHIGITPGEQAVWGTHPIRSLQRAVEAAGAVYSDYTKLTTLEFLLEGQDLKVFPVKGAKNDYYQIRERLMEALLDSIMKNPVYSVYLFQSKAIQLQVHPELYEKLYKTVLRIFEGEANGEVLEMFRKIGFSDVDFEHLINYSGIPGGFGKLFFAYIAQLRSDDPEIIENIIEALKRFLSFEVVLDIQQRPVEGQKALFMNMMMVFLKYFQNRPLKKTFELYWLLKHINAVKEIAPYGAVIRRALLDSVIDIFSKRINNSKYELEDLRLKKLFRETMHPFEGIRFEESPYGDRERAYIEEHLRPMQKAVTFRLREYVRFRAQDQPWKTLIAKGLEYADEMYQEKDAVRPVLAEALMSVSPFHQTLHRKMIKGQLPSSDEDLVNALPVPPKTLSENDIKNMLDLFQIMGWHGLRDWRTFFERVTTTQKAALEAAAQPDTNQAKPAEQNQSSKEPARVFQLSFEGNEALTQEELIQTTGTSIEEIQISHMKQRILDAYHDRSFDRVEVEEIIQGDQAIFMISEGETLNPHRLFSENDDSMLAALTRHRTGSAAFVSGWQQYLRMKMEQPGIKNLPPVLFGRMKNLIWEIKKWAEAVQEPMAEGAVKNQIHGLIDSEWPKINIPAKRSELRVINPDSIDRIFQGKVGVMSDLSGGLSLSQLENDFEIPARLSSRMRLVFYNLKTVKRLEMRKRLQLLQDELGPDRVSLFEELPDKGSVARLPQDVILVTKGRDLQLGFTLPKAKHFLRGQYLGDETGLVPVLLLYMQSPWQALSSRVIDLSMVGTAIVEKVQEYFSNLVFQRAA